MRRSALPTPATAELAPLIRHARERLAAAGVPSPAHDARALARFALEHSDATRFELTERVSARFVALYDSLISRRASREPLQLITGATPFHEVTLATRPGVFIPRPETESLVEAAIAAAREVGSGAKVVDLCAGSGSIAVAVAHVLRDAHVWAVELDSVAVGLARENVARNGVRVVVKKGDASTALGELDGTVDVVVANPPYIPPDGVPREVEVREWDPPGALYGGGEDGLETPAGVVRAARRLLREGGTFVMEHADLQGAAVRALVAAVGGFSMIETRQDLGGRDRFVIARRTGR